MADLGAGTMVGAGNHFSFNGVIEPFQPKCLLSRKRKRGNSHDQFSELLLAAPVFDVLEGEMYACMSKR